MVCATQTMVVTRRLSCATQTMVVTHQVSCATQDGPKVVAEEAVDGHSEVHLVLVLEEVVSSNHCRDDVLLTGKDELADPEKRKQHVDKGQFHLAVPFVFDVLVDIHSFTCARNHPHTDHAPDDDVPGVKPTAIRVVKGRSFGVHLAFIWRSFVHLLYYRSWI